MCGCAQLSSSLLVKLNAHHHQQLGLLLLLLFFSEEEEFKPRELLTMRGQLCEKKKSLSLFKEVCVWKSHGTQLESKLDLELERGSQLSILHLTLPRASFVTFSFEKKGIKMMMMRGDYPLFSKARVRGNSRELSCAHLLASPSLLFLFAIQKLSIYPCVHLKEEKKIGPQIEAKFITSLWWTHMDSR